MDARIQKNTLGQSVGFPLPDWTPPVFPPRQVHEGERCRLEPLNPDEHAGELFEAVGTDTRGAVWTYLPYGPFQQFEDYRRWLDDFCTTPDPQFYAIRSQMSGTVVGLCSYLRIQPAAGSIEVGHLLYGPTLQRTPAATEAMYLLMKNAFELGYRRYEWKCDSLNAPSRAAAERLGFTFEGIFRQALVYKGRNRDTAWYAIIDRDWPALKAAFEQWLAPENFDDEGKQRHALSALTRHALESLTIRPGE